MENLKSVEISGTNITDIPYYLTFNSNVEVLNLKNNQIEYPNNKLTNMSYLKKLDLSFLGLKNVPKEIGYFQNLEELNLSG